MEIWENVDDLFLDGEIWKDIDDYPDYQVSNFGRIKSFKGKDIRILKQAEDDGYLFVNLSKNGKEKPKKVHKLLFETFNSCKLKKGEVIHHINENKSNNLLDNFQLMTDSDHKSLHNSREKHPRGMLGKHHSKGTKQLMRENHGDFSGKNHSMYGSKRPGEKSGNYKLTEQKVIKIRKLSDEGNLTQKEIAKMFGVHPMTISLIKLRKIWKHI